MSITSDAAGIAYQVQNEQGWTDATLLDVVLDYIGNQDSDDAFRDYLRERAPVPCCDCGTATCEACTNPLCEHECHQEASHERG